MQKIFITPGEPAGIGPDIALQIAQRNWDAELIFVCDPDLLAQRAKQIGLPIQTATLKYIPVKLKKAVIPGKLDIKNAEYVLECIKKAADYCLKDPTHHALVTGPVHKGIINEANIPFSGHTEFLASYCNVEHSVMLFVTDTLRVALATTHLPLSDVSKTITDKLLTTTLKILAAELKNKFHLMHPRITVCGLNPHAGEMGHLGREEIDIIIPTLEKLRQENINIIGPLPADTVFTEKYLITTDAVLAMYHDQALPIVKYISFGHAVNVTLGLPILRTSVDHGTALDVAGTKNADSGSLVAAIQWAIKLLSRQTEGT